MECVICRKKIEWEVPMLLVADEEVYVHEECWAEREREEEMGDDSDTHDWEPFAS